MLQLRCSEKSGAVIDKDWSFCLSNIYVVGGNRAATEKQKYENNGRKRDRKNIENDRNDLQSESNRSSVQYIIVESKASNTKHCLWPSWAGEHARRGQPDSGSGQLEVRHHEPGERNPAERPPVGSPRLRQVPEAP